MQNVNGLIGSRSPDRSSGYAALLLLVPAMFQYFVLITDGGSSGAFGPVAYGLTFNSMLLHLLQGRFDVDPAAIGYEGYLRDGAVYAYFGIYPALFRVFFLELADFASIDFTRLSCLTANSLMCLFKILSALIIWKSRDSNAATRPFFLSCLIAVVVIGGPQIQFLRASIYQEVMLWSGAFAAAFVLVIVHTLCRRGTFTPLSLALLALIAGLCLLTRVSTALGLHLAFGLLWLWSLWSAPRDQPVIRRIGPFLPALGILALFIVITAVVNFGRWGNPLVFVDLNRSLLGVIQTEYNDHLVRYGQFSLTRLWFGVLYYFCPIWVLRDSSGHLLWSDFVHRTIDLVELPPSSFLLSDPLIIGLAVYGGLAVMLGKTQQHRMQIALAAVGLAVPGLLMLTALWMTFRYRMEFYPVFELLAFVGFARLINTPRRQTATVFGLFGLAAVVSILAAHVLWLLYMLSPFGMGARAMEQSGLIGYYTSLLR